MADVSVTAASVVKASDTQMIDGILGATVTAGQTLYLDVTTNTWKLADANASVTTATVGGIAMNGGSSGQPVKVANGGSLNPGFTVVVGTTYVQSATPGAIAPIADIASGYYPTIIGVGITASNLALILKNAGVAVP
jgi:hypothetical protein